MTSIGWNDEEWAEALVYLQTPTQLLKFGAIGKPKFRFFRLSEDFKVISWVSKNKDALRSRIIIADILAIKLGQRTDKFSKNRRPDLERVSFSLIYERKNDVGETVTDTLDVVCKEQHEYDKWTNTIIGLHEGNVPVSAIVEAQKRLRRLQGQTSDAQMDAGSRSSISTRKEPKPVDTRQKKKQSRAQNEVYTSGCGEWGQTGLGEVGGTAAPQLIPSLLGKGVQAVACGHSHIVIHMDNGDLLVSGNRVGTGLKADTCVPRELPTPEVITSISCGLAHNAALSKTGLVYTWGSGFHGQLGHDNTQDKNIPCAIPQFTEEQDPVAAISCGGDFTVALSKHGRVFTWGSNASHALGLDTDTMSDEEEAATLDVCAPVLVTGLKIRIIAIAAGHEHVMARGDSGPMYAWGNNKFGQLGLGHKSPVIRPVAISALNGLDVVSMSCGYAHSACIVHTGSQDGESTSLYCWGMNAFGQLGIRGGDVHKPVLLTDEATQHNLKDVTCGAFHTIALDEEGHVWACGLNNHGQLAMAQNETSDPTEKRFKYVKAMEGKTVRHIAAGFYYSAFLAARMWVDDKDVTSCTNCREPFTFVNRKHHCRNCGAIFCGSCSSKKAAILKYGFAAPVRVCDTCFDVLQVS